MPDAREGRRETLVTSVLDAEPEQVLRVGGTSYVTIVSAVTLGTVFVALTFKWWLVSLVAGIAFLVAVMWWLWTGTGEIPDKDKKDIGHGISLPLYASGVKSTGWWAMFITMTGDGTAFASLVFGYFFFWTIHADFTGGTAGPGMFWPLVAGVLFATSWGATVGAREVNRRGRIGAARALLIGGALFAAAGCIAGARWSVDGWHGPDGPCLSGDCLDPRDLGHGSRRVWASSCSSIAWRAALPGGMTPEHDMDIHNVALYWHFMLVTAAITFSVIGLFPEAL